MLIQNEKENTYTGGPFDVIVILKHFSEGTYHAAFIEEVPLPGPVPDVESTNVVRLKSKFVRLMGAKTFEEASKHLEDLARKIELPEGNVVRSGYYLWDGQPLVVIANNWRVKNQRFEDVRPVDNAL
jgi:hypothetical protein